ncbi:hypothetical protein OPQ81_007314 [Rhizoctonia solani]|nr:hypothetical protein OPQ81_007314 [Rhizoctonia solani]
MYLKLEKDSSVVEDIEPPHAWTTTGDVEAWISKSVQSLLGREIDVSGDLFQQGMDSLTSAMLLRILKSTLHSSNPHVRSASININQQTIFDNPTVQQLAQLLVRISKDDNPSVDPVADSLQAIKDMIQKYDSDWHRQEAHTTEPVKKERVVVTGTTGGLGSHLLAQLLESDKVEKVWAMNRKSSKGNTRERQISSFDDKLLDTSLLKSEKLVFLDTDLEHPKLGLQDEMYNEIRTQATIIIHNAWQVNFNLRLQSFEPSILGARNLVDLAFGSSCASGFPRFVFTSSIAAVGSRGARRYLKEEPVGLEDGATSMGYGQSKLVTEKILESAKRAGLETCIIRLGQLTGDIKSGSWSTTDWVPSLIRSSLSVGCLPGAVGVVSWVPLDVAAHSIIETCVARELELPLVVHVSHSRPVSWMDMLRAFSESIGSQTGSQLPIVYLDEWDKVVAEAAACFKGSEKDRYKQFPSVKIQNMVDGMVRADKELRSHENTSSAELGGHPRLDTTMAETRSQTLRTTPGLGAEHVQKWVGYWASRGLFRAA